MTHADFLRFCQFRDKFKNQIEEWKNQLAGEESKIREVQKSLAKKDGVPEYSLDNILVYNKALDDVSENDDIKLIVIGDNPGKAEQLSENQRYLVGQAGKIAEGFFARNPELETDFRKNVIILNKTPFHTAKTKELGAFSKIIKSNYDENLATKIDKIIEESQIFMAEETASLAKDLGLEIWLVGYSELKPKGIFSIYKESLKSAFEDFAKSKVYIYQHFSMNRFLVDLKESSDSSKSLKENLISIGENHRKEIFGL